MAATLAHARVLPGGAAWSQRLRRGSALELSDLEGGANAVLLLLSADEPTERLSVPDTLKAQHIARITAQAALYSDMGRVLASVVEDTCGWHDPLCGHGPAARAALVLELAKLGLGPRDLAPTINLFSRVTADAAGRLRLHSGSSPAGSRVVVRADMDLLVLLTTTPHPLEGPAPAARPLGVGVREVGVAGPDDPVRLACPENERGFAATDRYHA